MFGEQENAMAAVTPFRNGLKTNTVLLIDQIMASQSQEKPLHEGRDMSSGEFPIRPKQKDRVE
jgi:hypothetical protein